MVDIFTYDNVEFIGSNSRFYYCTFSFRPYTNLAPRLLTFVNAIYVPLSTKVYTYFENGELGYTHTNDIGFEEGDTKKLQQKSAILEISKTQESNTLVISNFKLMIGSHRIYAAHLAKHLPYSIEKRIELSFLFDTNTEDLFRMRKCTVFFQGDKIAENGTRKSIVNDVNAALVEDEISYSSDSTFTFIDLMVKSISRQCTLMADTESNGNYNTNDKHRHNIKDNVSAYTSAGDEFNRSINIPPHIKYNSMQTTDNSYHSDENFAMKNIYPPKITTTTHTKYLNDTQNDLPHFRSMRSITSETELLNNKCGPNYLCKSTPQQYSLHEKPTLNIPFSQPITKNLEISDSFMNLRTARNSQCSFKSLNEMAEKRSPDLNNIENQVDKSQITMSSDPVSSLSDDSVNSKSYREINQSLEKSKECIRSNTNYKNEDVINKSIPYQTKAQQNKMKTEDTYQEKSQYSRFSRLRKSLTNKSSSITAKRMKKESMGDKKSGEHSKNKSANITKSLNIDKKISDWLSVFRQRKITPQQESQTKPNETKTSSQRKKLSVKTEKNIKTPVVNESEIKPIKQKSFPTKSNTNSNTANKISMSISETKNNGKVPVKPVNKYYRTNNVFTDAGKEKILKNCTSTLNLNKKQSSPTIYQTKSNYHKVKPNTSMGNEQFVKVPSEICHIASNSMKEPSTNVPLKENYEIVNDNDKKESVDCHIFYCMKCGHRNMQPISALKSEGDIAISQSEVLSTNLTQVKHNTKVLSDRKIAGGDVPSQRHVQRTVNKPSVGKTNLYNSRNNMKERSLKSFAIDNRINVNRYNRPSSIALGSTYSYNSTSSMNRYNGLPKRNQRFTVVKRPPNSVKFHTTPLYNNDMHGSKVTDLNDATVMHEIDNSTSLSNRQFPQNHFGRRGMRPQNAMWNNANSSKAKVFVSEMAAQNIGYNY